MKKNFKKYTVALMAAAMLAGSLTACGGSDDKETTAAVEETTEAVEEETTEAVEEETAETAEDASQTRLAQILSQHTTPEAALGYMVFALLYFPCLATIAAVKGESGQWKWAIFTAAYTTVLAYVAAFAVYRIALLF